MAPAVLEHPEAGTQETKTPMSSFNSTRPQSPQRICKLPGCEQDISSMRTDALFCCRSHANKAKYVKKGRRYGLSPASIVPIGTRKKLKSGYVSIKTEEGWRPEHAAIVESIIGRQLRKGETVHHRNGVKDDNRIHNLELWASSHRSGQRVSDLVNYALEILEIYGEDFGFEVVRKTPVGPLWHLG